MCVSSARPLTSPTAYSQSPPPTTAMWSSVVRYPWDSPTSTPTRSRPMSSVTGIRPAQTTISSTSNVDPPAVIFAGPPWIWPMPVSSTRGRSTDSTSVPTRTLIPRSANCSAIDSPTNGSCPPSRDGPISTTVTSRAPSPFSHVDDSQATTPPPTTSTRSGSSRMLVTSREVQGLASRRPATGGTAAVRAGGDDDGMPRLERTSRPIARGQLDRLLARQARRAPDHVDSGALGPLDLAGVVMVMGEGVAPFEHRVEVKRPRQHLGDAGYRPGVVEQLDGSQQHLARHTSPVRAFAAHELVLHQRRRPVAVLNGVVRGVLPGCAGADHDHIPRAHGAPPIRLPCRPRIIA